MEKAFLALICCVPCVGCGGVPAEQIDSAQQPVVNLGVSRSVYENKPGFPSQMTPINCPQANNTNDPGHWNCVSPIAGFSSQPGDYPNHAPQSDAFYNGELCIPATGGWEWFYLAESAPLRGHGVITGITQLTPTFTFWPFSYPSAFTGVTLQTCLWRLGAMSCKNISIGANIPQIAQATGIAYPTDPLTGLPWSQSVAFGDNTLDQDVVMGIGVAGPFNAGLCFGSAWLNVGYNAQF